MIDVRSDTVTKPSDGMREAMAKAEVGDDVFGEDPSVNALQDKVAALYGKEAALYVPSGSMANQISINAHTQPGNEVICEVGCHLYNYEAGAPSMLSGVMLRTLDGKMGSLTVEQISQNIRPDNAHFAKTALIALENTHNRAGGTIFPLEQIKEISKFAKESGIKMHLDGARLMNAVAETGIAPPEWTSHFDSATLCLSKGLGAPVGSIITGTEDFINKAHRYRKAYGGGMRQAGILAAAGIYALDNNVKRLAEDHKNAKSFAKSIAGLDGFSIDLEWVHTNIVMIDIDPKFGAAAKWADALGAAGIGILATGPQRLRAVFHLDVSSDDTKKAIEIFEQVHNTLSIRTGE